jgi:hypothetical protein
MTFLERVQSPIDVEEQLHTSLHMTLLEKPVHVGAYSTEGDAQLLADLFIRHALRKELHDGGLARRETELELKGG